MSAPGSALSRSASSISGGHGAATTRAARRAGPAPLGPVRRPAGFPARTGAGWAATCNTHPFGLLMTLILILSALLVGVLLRREGAARDFRRELGRGGAQHPGEVRVALGELRRAGGQPGHVL